MLIDFGKALIMQLVIQLSLFMLLFPCPIILPEMLIPTNRVLFGQSKKMHMKELCDSKACYKYKVM